LKLETVKRIYKKLNTRNFGGVLTEPKFFFSRMRDDHAKYDGIAMHFNLADTKGYIAVTELIYHEIIHQYIDEFLGFTNYDDHGKEFKKQYNKFSFGVTMDKTYVL